MSEDKEIREKYMSEWINCSMGDSNELKKLKDRMPQGIINWIENEMEELKKRKSVINIGSINPITFQALTTKGWVSLINDKVSKEHEEE